jgi:hypothetical protein
VLSTKLRVKSAVLPSEDIALFSRADKGKGKGKGTYGGQYRGAGSARGSPCTGVYGGSGG